MIFGHPKWPTAAILSFKMGFGGHFVKKKNLKIRVDMKWPEMRPNVIFGHPKWPPAANSQNKNCGIDLKW